MILQENGTRFCTEGKVFTIGGIICANDESEYAGLCGTVMEIRSGDDCETENNTPDIYCAFDPPTSENTVVLWDVRMTSAELKHRAELQEWAAQIQECRSSGLSVSEWCRQQGVTTTLLASFSGIPLSFAEAQILPSKKTVKMLRSGLKK